MRTSWKSPKGKPGKQSLMLRIIAPVTLWAIGRTFEIPPVKRAISKADDRLQAGKKDVYRSLHRGARNAARRRGWLAASAAAFALGVSFMARAARPR